MDHLHSHPPHQHTTASTHRAHRINSIKHSLKDFALISKNKTLVQKKLSLQCQTLSQNGSSDGLSLECEDSTIYSPYQHAQIFSQKYEMIAKLGEGSDGVVHRCKKKRSGIDYAVKSFMFDDEHIPQIRKNFVLVKGLTHRNIIKYQALYLDLKKHACWLVMELCEAPSLARLDVSSETQLREIIQQLLQTLHYLHQRAVSHRDIKPENILYDPNSKRLKLIDYGICRKHRRRGTKFQMLTITGTLYYRAPEMFSGGGYTEKVDIWSTGIMIYKLITGHTPFESQYHSKTIDNIMNAQLIFPSQFDRYSPSLKHLIAKMLRKNARQRPSALDCLRQSWFYSSNSHFSYNFMFSQDTNEQDLECLKSPMLEAMEQGSYIRKINGDQYHCFDSDDEGVRKGVGVKKVHRSVTLEMGFHSMNNFQL